jgi:hypothetical protein
VEELTFQTVNERMNVYLGRVSESVEELWLGEIFDCDRKLGYRKVYRPLLAYKMLYDLAEVDTPEGWRLFLDANSDLLDALTDAIRLNGDEDMANKLRGAYSNAASVDDYDWVRDFIMGNAKHLRNRMTLYVRKNLEWFY